VEMVPELVLDGGWSFRAQARARYDWTLMAINDQPIALFVEGSYRRFADTPYSYAGFEIGTSAGVSMHWMLHH
jgi:hypothetical protein